MNPYWGSTFFEFFSLLFTRFFSSAILTPQADEIQIGVLGCVALSCGLIGPFLVLKRMTMFANALSHTILLGIIGAFLCASFFWGGAMFDPITLLLGALIAAFLTAILTEGIVRLFRIQEDASVGLVFSTLFALGVVLATVFTRNAHLSSEAVMGNADALQGSDFQLSAISAVFNIGAVLLFYKQLQISSFDRSYALTLGVRSGFFHFLLLFLSAAVCVGAFRAVGVLLVLAFLTGPYLTARLFCNRLSHLLIISPAIGILASMIGVAFSRHLLSVYGLPLSTGGIVVCILGLFYGIAVFFKFAARDTFLLCKRKLLFSEAPGRSE